VDEEEIDGSAARVAGARRIVVKVGTSTLTDAAGRLDEAFIADLAGQLAERHAAGCDVILVTSGAIRAGRDILEADRPAAQLRTPNPASLPFKQAAAAVGQGRLIHTYSEAFAARGVHVAQVLLTRNDLADRRRFLNARNTLQALLALRVVPIINENDTVAVEEIRFGDNDNLAAHVAVVVEADLLLILSDVEGLYDRRPDSAGETPPCVLRCVPRITPEIEALAGGAGTRVGTGGMRTKLEAARAATTSGIPTVIARGRRPGVVAEVAEGAEVGTLFPPVEGRLRGRKRWIVAGSRPRGALTVNAGAAERMRAEKASLLAVGITGVEGLFSAGDLVEVRDEAGRRFARGLTNYGAEDLRRIQGLRSREIEQALGSKPYDEVLHRDNLVVDG
jgi:glutamate 5-kinase